VETWTLGLAERAESLETRPLRRAGILIARGLRGAIL
jgi:hypothetical protein